MTKRFGWKAIYEDCVIKQFASVEQTSKVFDERGMPKKLFVGNKYGVNLETGELLINGRWQQIADIDGVPLKPTALIYFRRVSKTINKEEFRKGLVEFTGNNGSIIHFVGYRYNGGDVRLCITENGKAHICTGTQPEKETNYWPKV